MLEALIPAAGASLRYGRCKLLEPWFDATVIEHAIACCRACDRIWIVTGAYHDQLVNALAERVATAEQPIEIIFNARWREGMGTTIAHAVATIEPKSATTDQSALMVLLADQVGLEQEHIQVLLQRWREDRSRVVCAGYSGRQGVPAVFPRAYWPALKQLRGDQGARHWLANHPLTLTVAVPEAAEDLDTVEDYIRIQNRCP